MNAELNDTANARLFHHENRSWQSEIGSWEIDLMFCFRMLEIYGLKADSNQLRSTQQNLKREITDFTSTRIADLKQRLKTNEAKLVRLIEDAVLLKDRQMIYRQNDDRAQMNMVRAEIHDLQKHLYEFIDQMKSM